MAVSERQKKNKGKGANIHWIPTMCLVNAMRETEVIEFLETILSSNDNKNKNNSKHLCQIYYVPGNILCINSFN